MYSVAIYFRKYLTLYNFHVLYEGRMSSSDEEQDNKFLFCKGSNSYKYADLDIWPQLVKSLVIVIRAHLVKVYNNYASAQIIYKVNIFIFTYYLFSIKK